MMLTTADSLVVVDDDAYARYIACGPSVTAFLGSRVALVVDAAAGLPTREWARPPVASALDAIERLLVAFDGAVGRVPALDAPYRGRVRIEVAFLDGAAGLANHGVAGVAVGPAFIRELVESAARGVVVMPHVLCYEFMRNYIFPEVFTEKLDYCLRESRAPGAPLSETCWGWCNQGAVNVVGTLLLDELDAPPVGFDYHGHTREAFLGGMEAQLARYVSGGAPWEETFMHERLPWDGASSLDNVFSGALVVLWRAHGRGAFLRRFFAALDGLRSPAGKADVGAARDNFFLAACAGARADLGALFDEWRWPRSDAARAEAESRVGKHNLFN